MNISEEISTRLAECLDTLPVQAHNVLDLGAGTGLLTQKLQKRFPEAHIVAADNLETPLATGSIDLVASNLMLPWHPDLKTVFQEIKRSLTPHGLWLFSTFGPNTLRELHYVHNFIDMHDIGDMLLQCQFEDPVMSVETLLITYPDIYALLRELKDTGFNPQDSQLTNPATLSVSFEIIYGVAWNQSPYRPPKTEEPTEFYVPIDKIARTRG